MPQDLEQLERSATERARSFLKELAAVEEEVERGGIPEFNASFKISLLHVIDDLDAFAAAAERVPEQAGAEAAKAAFTSTSQVLEVWGDMNLALNRAVMRAVRGEVGKEFKLLSPIANNANLRTRRRLLGLRERFTGFIARANRVAEVTGRMAALSDEQLAAALAKAPGATVDAGGSPEPAPGAAPAPEAAVTPPAQAQSHAAPAPPSLRAAGAAATPPAPVRVAPVSSAPAPPASAPAGKPHALDYTFLFEEPPGEETGVSPFDECLAHLAKGEELERNEAMAQLLTRYQPELVAGLIRGAARQDMGLGRVLDLLWTNAEMVLLEDYFYSHRRTKLTSFLSMAEPYPSAGKFRALLDLFLPSAGGYPPADEGLRQVEGRYPAERTVFLRSMLVHPLEEYRRYAVATLEPSEFWSVVSYPRTPVPALADILDRLMKPDIPEDHRKVFVDCTHKTLLDTRDPVDVQAARRIMNALFGFDFLIEDDYFQHVLEINESVERAEKRLGFEDPVISQYVEILKAQKDEVGARPTRPPSFAGIPLTLQRKLAREGMHLLLFVRHPHPKVALETIRHINTSARAQQVVELANVNSLVLVEIAKREELFRSAPARLALVGNPRVPLVAAQRYIPLLLPADLKRFAASHDVNPEVAAYIRNFLQRRAI